MPNSSNAGNAAAILSVSDSVEAAPIAAGTTDAAAPAVPLGDAAARSVLVQNPSGNSDTVFVGDDGAQPIELLPGATITVACAQLSQVYVRSDAGTQTVNYIAELQAS